MSHVIFKINWSVEDCELCKPYYIGQTKNSIIKKMTKILQNGALKDHMRNNKINISTRQEIVKDVSCIKKFVNLKKQKKYETLMILKRIKY